MRASAAALGSQRSKKHGTHKVKCMPEEREVQDWVQMKQAAEAVTDAIGSGREVEMEDSTVGRSSDDESTASVSQAKKTEVQKSELSRSRSLWRCRGRTWSTTQKNRRPMFGWSVNAQGRQ